jgi:RNA polymerase sigma factor (sigma-70 family)
MTLLDLINANLGIAHKVCRIYFRDPADREDAMQEMMYQLWRSYGKFDGRSKFSTWMYSVCLNTALTYKRKFKDSEPLSEEYDLVDEADPKEERTEMLMKMIHTLSPINKAIMLLYLEEMSYEEIAEITGLTKSNVSVRIMRTKQELRIKS